MRRGERRLEHAVNKNRAVVQGEFFKNDVENSDEKVKAEEIKEVGADLFEGFFLKQVFYAETAENQNGQESGD